MMTKLVLALLQMSTGNFAKLALVINAKVKTSSNLKCIQRFINGYRFDQERFVRFAWSHFRCLRNQRIVFQHRLFMGGCKIGAKEYLILVSDTPLKHQGKMYAERWGIEVFLVAANDEVSILKICT